jgi:uncharacterized protein (DUF2384 family)
MNKELIKNMEKVKIAELEFLEETFGNQSKVASILDVKRSSITRWHNGEKPDGQNMTKLAEINLILTRLISFFKNVDIARAWLFGTNAHLNDQVPIKLLKKGEFNKVNDALDQYFAGTYA